MCGWKSAAGQLGFAVEPAPEVGIRLNVHRQDLERVTAEQPGVLSEVDLTHPSRAE